MQLQRHPLRTKQKSPLQQGAPIKTGSGQTGRRPGPANRPKILIPLIRGDNVNAMDFFYGDAFSI